MNLKHFPRLGLALVCLTGNVLAAQGLGTGVLFYGGGLVERLLEGGEMEACLQLAQPDSGLKVRSLAWTGDEVGYRLRPEGYVEHMKGLLAEWPADTVVIGFGNNESFRGTAGLSEFRKDWEVYLGEIRSLHSSARVVLLGPVASQSGGALDLAARNRDIQAYSDVIQETALRHGVQFVDLFAACGRVFAKSSVPLTDRGIHLNEEGTRAIGRIVAEALLGKEAIEALPAKRVSEVAKAAAQKAGYVADVVRPKNGVVYYGVRKRPEEYAAEIPRMHQLITQSDAVIHALVRDAAKGFSEYPAPSLPPLPEGKSVPDRFSGGILKEPAEQLKDLTVAAGYSLNLFASEADFPELKNPVQIAFDARGRLWVVTMPSFPHTIPGEKSDDRILILEDTDRDGKADRCTTFAGGFDALDGVAFHERGVIVSAQPRLLLLNDTDGDGRADTREELLRGVDVTDSHHGGMIATDPLGHVIFSDGVFHRSQFETPYGVVRGIDSTTYRLDITTGRIVFEWQGLTPNPWKVAFDRFGTLFQRFGGGHVLDGLPQTWTPLGAAHPYGNATVVNYAKGSSLSIVSSPNFPERYQQGVVSSSLLGSYIVSMSAANVDAGAMVGVDRLDLLSSQNSAFRPVDTAFGMDGALYVSDFASRIIGHAQHPMRDPQWNHTRGRIWRVVSNEKALVREWPRIEGAPVPELLELLLHPQDLVREHARIQLRKIAPADLVPAVDAWVWGLDRARPSTEQGLLEAVLVLASKGFARGVWMQELMKSPDPRMRSAAVLAVRFLSRQMPDAQGFLVEAARDAHPRVRMAVLNTVSHLRSMESAPSARPAGAAVDGHVHAGSGFSAETVINAVEPEGEGVQKMLKDLKAGTVAKRGRSIPVLSMDPSTRVGQWLEAGVSEGVNLSAFPSPADLAKANAAGVKSRTYRTFCEADDRKTALISLKHSFLDITVNGVQVFSADNPFSSQQQVEVELVKGLNVVSIDFRRLKEKAAPPPVYVYDTTGAPLSGVRFAGDPAALEAFAAEWNKAQAADAGALRVQAVPNLMQFAPRELRVQAGRPVRLIFENPDLMQHNLVVVAAGAEEEVGKLADLMATKADGMAKNFVPDSPSVLSATPLVNPGGRSEISFTAPRAPGRYAFLCTFPGHWRIMRGDLVVE
jgi:azurin/glucose/arabinose dehydrogenase